MQTWPLEIFVLVFVRHPTPGLRVSAPMIPKNPVRDIMFGSAIKKRHVQGTNTDNMEAPTAQHTTKARTVTWHELSEWQRDNKYILSGYRPEKADYMEILTSLTFLHNETCNVYTHLIGALLLPLFAISVMQILSEPQFFDVSGTDYIMFGIFFCCAECCLVFSAIYHLVGPHSHAVEQFWLTMDLLGIVIVTVGTFIPGIYYVFICDPGLQKLHWTIVRQSERPPLSLDSSRDRVQIL